MPLQLFLLKKSMKGRVLTFRDLITRLDKHDNEGRMNIRQVNNMINREEWNALLSKMQEDEFDEYTLYFSGPNGSTPDSEDIIKMYIRLLLRWAGFKEKHFDTLFEYRTRNGYVFLWYKIPGYVLSKKKKKKAKTEVLSEEEDLYSRLYHGMPIEPAWLKKTEAYQIAFDQFQRTVKKAIQYAQADRVDYLKQMLESGFDPNAQDANGWTILMASFKSKDVLEYMLSFPGVRLDVENNQGETAVDIFTKFATPEIYNRLIQG